ncbi:MAG: RagB/SusD family nutrient uptake outer membrane protein [Bacteroidota bacterium]
MKHTNYQILKKRLSSLGYLAILSTVLFTSSCKKELNQVNPNSPTIGGNVNNEAGIAAYALGGVYWSGFNYGDAWLGNSYFSLPWGYHELMGDVAGGGSGSNNQTTTMGVPEAMYPDPVGAPSTVVTNPSPEVSIIRSYNNTASTAAANNALFYEWTNMYALINSMNATLEALPGVAGLSADKAATVKAWAYWWKGYAYAAVGTMYYAGLIENKASTTNSNYVAQTAVIAESNTQLNNAITALKGISNQGDYNTMIAQLIPQQCQVGLGQPLSSAQWVKTINTMLARNILLNKLSPFVNGNPSATITGASIPAISAADWTAIIAYCNAGVQAGDYVFTARSTSVNSFFTPTGGTVASLSTLSNQVSTYKVSERLVQNYQAGDKRLANFTSSNGTFYGDAVSNSTRYGLVDAVTASLSGFQTLSSRQTGGIEVYMGPTYEENTLMLAEANIRSGNVPAGVALIDAVRNYQGAGLASLSTSLTVAQALNALTQERLAALAYRGLSYFDLRRWGWSYGQTKGGGRYGCNMLYNKVLYTNAFINYNYMDYWDVPADEIVKNTPGAGSAVVVNPNY